MATLDESITIANPDDPFGPPLYEGPVGDVHRHLIPGVYEVSSEDEAPESNYSLLVSDDSSARFAAGETELTSPRATSPVRDAKPSS